MKIKTYMMLVILAMTSVTFAANAVNIDVYPGWNLVPLYSTTLDDNVPGVIGEYDIIAKYVYYPAIGRYFNNKAGSGDAFTPSELALLLNYTNDVGYRYNQAQWIYVRQQKKFVLGEMYFDNSDAALGKMKLASGWNLVSISRRMQSSTYEEIAGTCNILIGALYNAKTQEWEVFARNGQQTVGGAMPFNTGTDLSGHGIAIKVSDDCQLGKIEPPTLPS